MSETIPYPVPIGFPRKSLNRICDKTGAKIDGRIEYPRDVCLRVMIPMEAWPEFRVLYNLVSDIWECYWRESDFTVFKKHHGFLHDFQEQEQEHWREQAKKLEAEFETKLKEK